MHTVFVWRSLSKLTNCGFKVFDVGILPTTLTAKPRAATEPLAWPFSCYLLSECFLQSQLNPLLGLHFVTSDILVARKHPRSKFGYTRPGGGQFEPIFLFTPRITKKPVPFCKYNGSSDSSYTEG